MTCVWRWMLPALLAAPPAGAQEIVLGPETDLRIVEQLPAEALEGVLADELRPYLLAVLGREEPAGEGRRVTFVLEAKYALWSDVPPEELETLADIDGFEIVISPGAVPTVRISAPTMLGASYGIEYFLERYLGVRQVMPGALGTVLPEPGPVTLAEGVERVRPAIVSRAYTGLLLPDMERKLAMQRSPAWDILMPERHHFTGWDYVRSARLHFLTHASHNMFNIFPVEQYGETLPEVYPIKDGERFIPESRDGWHPCYSNPNTLRIAIEKARAAFEGGAHCFSLGINDGRRVRCECPECTAAGWPQAYFNFVTRVAEAVREYYPPHIVGVLAYGDVKYPPEDLVLPENVLVLVTGGRLGAWEGHATHLGAYEYAYGTGFWVPNFPLKAMATNARRYAELGVSAYHAEVHPVWAFDAPKVYIQSRLLWDPSADVHALLREFCAAAFGAGGPAMEQFYLRWAALRDDDPVIDGLMQPTPMNLWRRSSGQFAQVSAEDYDFCRARLDEATARADDDGERARLTMVGRFLEYSRNAFEMNRLAGEVFTGDIPGDPVAVLDELSERRARRQALLDEMAAHPEWFEGSCTTREALTGPNFEGRASWTLNADVNSAVKTMLLAFAEDGREIAGELPADLRPYAVLPERVSLPVKLRPTHPWYPETRFVPMQAGDAEGRLEFATGPTDRRIEEGRGAGALKQHYAMGTIGMRPEPGPRVFVCDMTVTGRAGDLRVTTVNFALNMGWTPIDITRSFGDEEETVRLRFVVEPVYPDSEWIDRPTAHDIHVLWQPRDEGSALHGGFCVERLRYPEE